jgi:hypothetical protein
MLKFFRRGPSGPVSFEQQLSTLASCGIRLAAGLLPEALTISFERAAFEAEPYRLLMIAMGSEAETEEQAGETGYPSDNIWHFDTECIEDHDAYASIARRMSALAQGELPLEDISDYVDVEEGKAHVAFRIAGKEHHWDAKVEDDLLEQGESGHDRKADH